MPTGRNEAAQEADLVRRSYWDVACSDEKIRTQVAFLVFPSSETFRSPYVQVCPCNLTDGIYIQRNWRYIQSVPKTNGTRFNGFNFVTVKLKYLKFCRHKVKVLNDMHAKNQVNRTRKTCFTRYHIQITIFAKRVQVPPARWMHTSIRFLKLSITRLHWS